MHVAIIMNGNGRWAIRRGLPPTACHTVGATAVRRTVDSALQAGVKTLTLYALSSSTCDGSTHELDADLRVLDGYLRADGQRCAEQSVGITLIGHGKYLGAQRLRSALEETRTSRDVASKRMHVRIVIDYSAHDSVVQSTWCGAHPQASETFTRRLKEVDDTALTAGAVDLLIRTGGGNCRSEFMLWEVAYARLHHADCLWPDFTPRDFQRALSRVADYEPPSPSLRS